MTNNLQKLVDLIEKDDSTTTDFIDIKQALNIILDELRDIDIRLNEIQYKIYDL